MRIKPIYRRGEAMTVLLLTVVLLGALGFIAWQNFSKKDESSKGAEMTIKQEETTKSEEKPAEETYKGERISSIDGSVSFKVPNGWTIYRMGETTGWSLIAPMIGDKSKPAYDASQKPEIETMLDAGASSTNFSLSVKSGASPERTGSSSEFTLNNGVKGTKTVNAGVGCPSCIAGEGKNWTYITYIFEKNGEYVEMFWASTDDQEAFIDKVARTIEFK